LRFLSDVSCEDPSWVDYMQVLCGYFLIAGNGERKFYNFHGDGQNGKSSILNVLKNVMGGASESERGFYFTIPMSAVYRQNYGDSNGEELSRGMKARIAVAAESVEGKHLDEGKVKILTGGDEIAYREMYVGTRQGYPDFTLVLCTNHPLHFNGDDQALADRVVLIPFDYRIHKDKKKPKFAETVLFPEREGILAWMVEGARKYLSSGFPSCKRIEDETAKYIKANDLPRSFFEERCKKVQGINTPLQNLYEAFTEWCKSEGHKEVPTVKRFNKQFERVSRVRKHKTNRGYTWENLDLIDESGGEQEDDPMDYL